ncbi:MAG: hypothetical protein QOJ25_3424, partial [Solirubrobacteraceae bacterium]|nr:hypothetical protein [Solirubrobacteraceae bacterium]
MSGAKNHDRQGGAAASEAAASPEAATQVAAESAG